MNTEKIAIVIDSAVDLPIESLDKYSITQIPLRIIFSDKSYLDKVELTAADLFEKIKHEVPKTSLPSHEAILNEFNRLKSEGYTHILAFTISSALSGTYNVFKLAAKDIEGLEIFVLDTLNLSVGSSCFALHAAQMIESGSSFSQIVDDLKANVHNSKIFVCFSTLSFLRKGGRIGRVAGFMGELLDLKPVITIDNNGEFETFAKAKGWKKGLNVALNCAKDFVGNSTNFSVGFVYATMTDEIRALFDKTKETFHNAQAFFETQVSATLGVHTGPIAAAIGIQRF